MCGPADAKLSKSDRQAGPLSSRSDPEIETRLLSPSALD